MQVQAPHPMSAAPTAPTVPTAPGAPNVGGSADLASQLQQLSQLRASGALSEEEFQAAKDKLLGGA